MPTPTSTPTPVSTTATASTFAPTRTATPAPTATRTPSATPIAAAPYLDAERFAAEVEQASGLALVDFTADWCPPCRVLAPHIDALARELAGRLVVVKVNVDDEPALASRFGVKSMPTLIFFRDGQVVDRIIGAVPAAQLRARLNALAGR
jgi:thioredoxin 1